MRRVLILTAMLALLAGCAGKTTPDQWKQYARGAYLHGKADGRASVFCVPGEIRTHAMQAKCSEVAAEAAAIQEAAPAVDYDLTNNRKERERSLFRYLELGSRNAK